MFRYSIKLFLALAVVIAFFAAAILKPSDLLLKLVATGTVFAIAVAFAGMVAFSGSSRAFCAGFSVMGIVRFASEMFSMPLRAGFDRSDVFPRDLLFKLLSQHDGTDHYQTANRTICHAIIFSSAFLAGMITQLFYQLTQKSSDVDIKPTQIGG